MPYIGKSPEHGNFAELNDVSGSFNGSTTQFALTTRIGGIAITPVVEAALLISLDGVIQEPTTDYTVSGTNITFTTAPASTVSFFGVVMGRQLDVGTPSDATITQAKLASTFMTGATDIGGAIADADLFIIDDGAGGTLRKTAASRLKTYIGTDFSDPASADGDTLGSASLEWSDLYLADGGVIYFGNDQDINITHVADTGITTNGDFSVGDDLKLTSDSAVLSFGADNDVTITHDPDDGLFLKSTATADDNPFLLTLQTGETDLAADDVIGKIAFQAPDEGTGTDAILVSAAIQARAEGNHSSSSNATSLDFMTGASEAAAKKMSVTSGGDVNVLTDGASLFFGADSEIELRHVADDGLILKHVGTGDGKEPSLTFQAGDNDIAADDVLGSIFFQAPDEGAGTDAILVAAGIEAVSEGNFSSSNNATKLSFKTAASEAATEKMSLSSAGTLNLLDNTLQRANLKDYGEVTSALGSAGGARTINLEDGNNFTATVTSSTVTWTFSNPTASDELCGFTLFLTNGGSQTVNWPNSVDWAGGSAPSLTSSGLDILVFITTDGGTIWHGMVGSADSK